MNKKLFVISGCSGVGKGTVLKEFMAKNSKDFMLSVSCTTRKPREGEVDGINYFFLTQEEFKDCIAKENCKNPALILLLSSSLYSFKIPFVTFGNGSIFKNF